MSRAFPRIPKLVLRDVQAETANVVQFWGFFEEQDLASDPDALRMMDIDFGRKCSLQCPSCFRKRNAVDDSNRPDLTYAKLIEVIDEARTLGLQVIKVCGAGEPLEDPLLLQLARDLTERDIGLSVFTKAHVLGDDGFVRRLYGEQGIQDGMRLCSEFYNLKTSFLVSFQSTDPDVQDRLVGNVPGYTLKRNLGLERLAEVGFNKSVPTRLAICANPIMPENLPGLFEIYVYGRERNILPVNAALMVSGKQINSDFLSQHDVSAQEKEDLFVRTYNYNLSHGFSTKEQLRKQGVSCMPGIHTCNQIAVGVYLTLNGTVVRCPGDHGDPLGSVHDEPISKIWHRHRDWAFKSQFNCFCPFKDGITLPTGLHDRVLRRVLQS